MLPYKIIFPCLFFCLILGSHALTAQEMITESQQDTLNSKRLKGVIIGQSVLGAGSLAGLYSLWYADYPQSSFHFINDNNEWKGMDKVGHAMTSYYLGKVGYESLKWSGVKEKNATIYGGMLGWAYLGIVETFDGFSAEWGASPLDFACNSLGSAMFIAQQLAWKEQRILVKWSFHLTDHVGYNPSQLGRTFPERMLKDYNGQTYWLSANISSLAGMNGKFPPWLNIALGYGADGMIAPRSNPAEVNNNPIPHFKRQSQFYLSPDIDLTRIRTRSKTIRLLLNAVGFIKVPLPALEYSGNRLTLHYLYF